jgi:DNA-binding NarL/FixJ family response regulator
MVLDAQPDLEVVAEATDGEGAVARALADDVHLAILDISMPRKTGLQAAREITHRRPDVRVLMLSMHDNEQYLFEAIKAGASGYVLKSAVDRDLVEACRAAMRGEPFLYPGGIQALMREYIKRARAGRRSAARSSRRARRRSSSSSPRRTPMTRSASYCTSPRRPWSATGRSSSRSSGCTTASS